MIEKLSEYKITSRDGSFINVECNTKIINTLVRKINELVDAVNAMQNLWLEVATVKKIILELQTRSENVQTDTESRSENVKKDFFDCKENNLKCPFCQQELKELYVNGNSVGFRCKNKNCPETNIMCGTKMLWQALIDTKKKLDDLSDKNGKLKTELDCTRKALDVAKNGLKELKNIIACPPDVSYETGVSMYADGVLQEITALEQKGK